jgi:hypothetical protein
MYKQELNRLIDEALQDAFVSIYDKIIDQATNGINEYSFTIMCKKSTYIEEDCDVYNGYKQWIQNHIDVCYKYNFDHLELFYFSSSTFNYNQYNKQYKHFFTINELDIEIDQREIKIIELYAGDMFILKTV